MKGNTMKGLFVLALISSSTTVYAASNNYVEFKPDGAGLQRLSDASSFTIEDYSTGDESRDFSEGDKIRMRDSKFNFIVKRKGSSDVAEFYKQHINTNQNTFNHNPGSLNFAFLGSLTLNIENIQGNNPYTFDDIMLAQGHTGAANNWWFGGKNCNNVGAHFVECYGSDVHGQTVAMRFKRGGEQGVGNVNHIWYTVPYYI